jgi:hypothetical protein
MIKFLYYLPYIYDNNWSLVCRFRFGTLYINRYCTISDTQYVIFEILMAVKMSLLIFWVVMLCGHVGTYQRFWKTQFLHLQARQLWRWTKYVSPKHLYLPTSPHSIIQPKWTSSTMPDTSHISSSTYVYTHDTQPDPTWGWKSIVARSELCSTTWKYWKSYQCHMLLITLICYVFKWGGGGHNSVSSEVSQLYVNSRHIWHLSGSTNSVLISKPPKWFWQELKFDLLTLSDWVLHWTKMWFLWMSKFNTGPETLKPYSAQNCNIMPKNIMPVRTYFTRINSW